MFLSVVLPFGMASPESTDNYLPGETQALRRACDRRHFIRPQRRLWTTWPAARLGTKDIP